MPNPSTTAPIPSLPDDWVQAAVNTLADVMIARLAQLPATHRAQRARSARCSSVSSGATRTPTLRRMRGRACPWRSTPTDTNCNWETKDRERRRYRWRAGPARNEANSSTNYLTKLHMLWKHSASGAKAPLLAPLYGGAEAPPFLFSHSQNCF